MKSFRKILKTLLFSPLLPILFIPDGTGGELNNKNDDLKDNIKENKNNSNDSEKDKEKLNKEFSSDDVNRIVGERLEREKTKIEKAVRAEIEEEKRKSNLSEVDKLKEEKEDTEKKASEKIEKANKKLIAAEVKLKSVELGIIDSDAAYALMNKNDIEIDENGIVSGVEESLKSLIETKKYLIKSGNEESKNVGDDQQGKGNSKNGLDMNTLIRRSAGY